MVDPAKIQIQKELTRVWVTALEQSARDFFPRPREFCVRAYEHVADNWMNIMTKDYGFHIKPAKNLKEGVEAYIDLGLRSGLFEDASQFILKDVSPNRLEIAVFKCNYLPCCEDLLKQGYKISDLSCSRLGCFSGAIRRLTDIECNYRVTDFAPTKCCQGYIERI